jgi:membrane protein DedA with SNARE-associated domain
VAGTLWASYAALLGYWGGKRFENQPWKGLLVAFAVAVAASGIIELARRLLRGRGAAAEAE